MKSEKDKNQQSPPRSPKNVDWTQTPVYKQFVLKLTETESLENNEIGFRNYKKRSRNKTYQQFQLDLKNKVLMKKLLEETLSNIYSEEEI